MTQSENHHTERNYPELLNANYGPSNTVSMPFPSPQTQFPVILGTGRIMLVNHRVALDYQERAQGAGLVSLEHIDASEVIKRDRKLRLQGLLVIKVNWHMYLKPAVLAACFCAVTDSLSLELQTLCSVLLNAFILL